MNKQKNNNIEGLRAVACLMVLVFHTLSIPLLWWGVDIFFVIAGYLNTKSILGKVRKKTSNDGEIEDEESKNSNFAIFQYYLFRFIRIVPAYFIAIALVYAFRPSVFESNPLFYHFTFTNNIYDAFSGKTTSADLAIGPFWSIAAEMQFYLIWPLLLSIFTNYGSNVKATRVFIFSLVLLPVIFRGVTCVIYPKNSFYTIYSMLPCRLDLFALGAALALRSAFRVNIKKMIPLGILNVIIFGILSVVFSDFRTSTNSILFSTFGYSSLAFSAFFLVAIVLDNDFGFIVKRILQIPALVWIGSLSYVIYLLQGLVIEVLKTSEVNGLLSLLMSLPILLGLAWFINLVIERPLNSFKNRLFR